MLGAFLAGRLTHYIRSEEHTSELQSQFHLVCRLLLEKKKPENISAQSVGAELHDHDAMPHSCANVGSGHALASAVLPQLYDCDPSFFFMYDKTPMLDTLSLHDALPI